MYAFALPREYRSSEICVEINRKTWKKNIPDIIDRNLKKDQQILIIFRNKYFWHNWLLNKSFSFHLTQRMLLHYLGKADQA